MRFSIAVGSRHGGDDPGFQRSPFAGDAQHGLPDAELYLFTIILPAVGFAAPLYLP